MINVNVYHTYEVSMHMEPFQNTSEVLVHCFLYLVKGRCFNWIGDDGGYLGRRLSDCERTTTGFVLGGMTTGFEFELEWTSTGFELEWTTTGFGFGLE